MKERRMDSDSSRGSDVQGSEASPAMVDKAMATFTDAINSTGPCERCKGVGYHHGFGEHGHDPDWCEVCGGSGFVPGCDDKTAMKKAIEAALAYAPPSAPAKGREMASGAEREGTSESPSGDALNIDDFAFTAALLRARDPETVKTTLTSHYHIILAALDLAAATVRQSR